MTDLLQFFMIRKFGVKMEIKALPMGMIGANCYMVTGERGAVLIDTGGYSPVLEQFLKENEDKERLILLTHAHFDHIGGALRLRENMGVKIGIGEKEAPSLSDGELNLSNRFRVNLAPFSADMTFADGEKISVGDLEFTVIETAGHTVGGVCYLIEDCLFSGDTLFYESIGRTDFVGGDIGVLNKSLLKLMGLKGDTVVFAGHGESTTIEHERRYNPFIRGNYEAL